MTSGLKMSPIDLTKQLYGNNVSTKRNSMTKLSPFKSKIMKHSHSKMEISTNYSRRQNQTSSKLNKSSNNLHSHTVGPNSIPPAFDDKNTEPEIADETSIVIANKNFMDEYYASNGYFCFSANRKELRAKDAMYDRLQTFVDERLLQVATQISVKQRKEEEHEENIDKLTELKNDIDDLIHENERIMQVKAHADAHNQKLTEETDALLAKVRGYRSKLNETKFAWGEKAQDLYATLEDAKESYNQTEAEYQMNKQDIRVEMHEDATLIKTLETSLAEADEICASLAEKARFSNKLETERQKMIRDRALLLNDL